MLDGVSGDNNKITLKFEGSVKSIKLDKLKGLKINSVFNNLKLDINGDGKIDEKDKLDLNANGILDTDDEAGLMRKFLLSISNENREITEQVFPDIDVSENKKYMEALADIAQQQTALEETVEDSSVDDNSSERVTTMKVSPGWGNLRIAKEALKAQGIENPTAEQIQKARVAIEEANPDQVKTWKKDNNPNIPKGTKYFYANAEIKIPDLKAVLGIEEVERVENTEDVGELTPTGEETSPTTQSETECVISNSTKQSKKTNDCWLLSGTNALLSTSWGREALNEAIKKEANGDVTVTLKGANNKKIKVTKAEITQAKASGLYSEGDDNMIALEIAINKYKDELHPQSESERRLNGLQINWGDGYELFQLITGKEVKRKTGFDPIGRRYPDYVKKGLDVEKALDTMRDNPDEVAMVVSFTNPNNPLGKFVIDGVEISPKHAYAVVGIEKDADGKEYVILINPRNSGEKIKVSKEEFLKHLDAADAISKNDDSLEIEESSFNFPPLS
ncbi:MAG: hypothetical protein ACI37Q_07330 [Candidatus Gastranaerophilaceae bacterium]